MKKKWIGLSIMFVILALSLFAVLYEYPLWGIALSLNHVVEEEQIRIPSPDNVVDAVLITTDGNATTSKAYKLFILPHGAKKEEDEAALFVADHLSEFKMFWRENKFLEISYNEARIFQFTNFWQSKKVQDFQYVVEIKLSPQSESWSLNKSDRWIFEP